MGPVGLGVLSPEVPEASSLGIFVILIYGLEQRFKDSRTKEPGNLGDPAGIIEWAGSSDISASNVPSFSVDMRNKEINHGRMAMSAVAVEFLTEYLDQVGPREQLDRLFAGPFLPALLAFVLIVQQTPEYSEEELNILK